MILEEKIVRKVVNLIYEIVILRLGKNDREKNRKKSEKFWKT